MLIPFAPLKYRKRRARSKRKPAPPVPPGPPLIVFENATDDPPLPARCFWGFDGDVTVTGTCTGLQVLIGGVWRDPVSSAQEESMRILCVYATSEMLNGKQWRIVSTPSGIAEAARVVVPQDGTIIAP